MLKVVGASWLQTRISTLIVAGALLIAISALFMIGMERPQYDGTYCATGYWNYQSSFRIEYWGQRTDLNDIAKGVARICYKDSIQQNGWSQIEIETQPEYPDWIQAFSAGMLEGALSWNNIYNHWLNTIKGYCEMDNESLLFCEWARKTLSESFRVSKKHADTRGKHDSYYHQIRLFYYQLEGLEYGFRKGVKRSRADIKIPQTDFILLNAASDLLDLRIYYDLFVDKNSSRIDTQIYYQLKIPKATMIFKFLNDTEKDITDEQLTNNIGVRDHAGDNALLKRKILFGHSSDGSYASMLRIVKKYRFHYHLHKERGHRQVPGTDIIFTGYPGNLASSDDFYITTGAKIKLTIGGIRIQNNNLDLWKSVKMEHLMLLSARVMASNRLAYSGRKWVKMMSRHPQFGAKQWFIINVKRLQHFIEYKSLNLNRKLLTDDEGNYNSHNNNGDDEIHSASIINDADHKNFINNNIDNESDINDNGRSINTPASTIISSATVTDTITIDEFKLNNLTNKMKKDVIWIIDQLPGRLHAEDMTIDIIFGSGYWLGTGIPYFKKSLEDSHNRIVNDDDDNESEEHAKQFQNYITNITDLDTISNLLHSHGYRGDLMGQNSSAFGNIDMKLYSATTLNETEFRVLSGPLYQTSSIQQQEHEKLQFGNNSVLVSGHNVIQNSRDVNDEFFDYDDDDIDYIERRSIRDDLRAIALMNKQKLAIKNSIPFRWSKSHLNVQHYGHPDVWNFAAISPNWAWREEIYT